MSLEKMYPEVAKEFHDGNCVMYMTARKFPAKAIDQAYKQNNAVIKGDGGAVDLTEDA